MFSRRQLAFDALGLAGIASITEGAREIYQPAGWIIAGLFVVAYAVMASRGRA